MNYFTTVIKTAALILVSVSFYSAPVAAQESKTLGKGPIVVRLCPINCVAVNGHGLKSGGTITAYETKSGWIRVSDFLNRARLVKSFGSNITEKPALWVSAGQMAGAPKAEKPVSQAAKPKPATPRRPVLKRIAIPTFRPGSGFVQQAETATATPQQTPVETQPEAQVTQEEAPKTETETVVVTEPVVVETPPVVVESEPATSSPAGEGTGRQLTWEELQAKLAEQASKRKIRSQLSAASRAALAKEQAELAAKQAERRKAADAAEAARQAKQKKDDEAAKSAELANAKKAEDSAKAAAEVKAEEEAAKAAESAAAKLAADAEAEKLAEQQKAAAAAAAAAAEEAKKVEQPKVEPAQELAVAVAKPEETPEPVYKAATSQPIDFGSRPKKMTKALLDKRLSKLPGSKSKVRKDVVIALRHYALGLLNSGECKGIAAGGASAAPGMLFVTCSDDPTYLRQFPLKEETW